MSQFEPTSIPPRWRPHRMLFPMAVFICGLGWLAGHLLGAVSEPRLVAWEREISPPTHRLATEAGGSGFAVVAPTSGSDSEVLGKSVNRTDSDTTQDSPTVGFSPDDLPARTGPTPAIGATTTSATVIEPDTPVADTPPSTTPSSTPSAKAGNVGSEELTEDDRQVSEARPRPATRESGDGPTPAEIGEQALARITYDWRSKLPGWTVNFLPGRQGLRGLTMPDERRIEVYVHTDDVWSIAAVTAHELGHAADLVFNDTGRRRAWKTQRDIPADAAWWGTPTSPDFNTGGGDFAECFATAQVGSESRSTWGRCSRKDLKLLTELVGS